MRRTLMSMAGIGCGVVVLASIARADSLVGVSSIFSGSDSISWASAPAGALCNPFTISSSGGITETVSQASGNARTEIDGPSFDLNFASGDHLLWNQGGGAVTINFASAVSEAGAQIDTTFVGTFTAQITAFGTAGNLGSATVMGLSQIIGNGGPAFIGINDTTGADITSIQFVITGGDMPTDFTIDTVDLNTVAAVAAAPTPSAFAAGGMVLGMLAMYRRRRVLG